MDALKTIRNKKSMWDVRYSTFSWWYPHANNHQTVWSSQRRVSSLVYSHSVAYSVFPTRGDVSRIEAPGISAGRNLTYGLLRPDEQVNKY